MKKFEVTITETLIKKIIIDAETVEEAENIADSVMSALSASNGW